MRLLNRIGRDSLSTGMAKVARAIDPLPPLFYDAADLAGLLYQNSLLEARLSRYPAFLPLAERSEFQALAQDKGFAELRLRRAPIRELLDNPNISTMVNSPEELRLLWNVVTPDLKDLRRFLETGKSEKYSEKILGRWLFDLNAVMVAYRKAKPNLPSSEMVKFRRTVAGNYARMMFIAMPDGSLAIKNMPQAKTPGGSETQNSSGHWKSVGSEYDINLGSGGDRRGKFEAGRLVLVGEGLTLVFTPED